jgi:membrane-bound lytic murein transglycosylase B
MQFIPSTWQMAGRDGNGDGVADPLNIDDAALSAASYLCAGGRDLTTARGWTDAVLAYNQSDTYVRQVRDQATAYDAQSPTAG